MQKGRLIQWFDDKGYGFIRPNAGGDDVFLHIRDVISHTTRDPRPGDTFIYEIDFDKEGRTHAVKASITGFAFSGFTVVAVLAALGFIVYLLLAYFRYLPLSPIAAIYTGMSLLTIWTYSRDKHAAQLGRWRTREIRLHLLELLGGWPGAFLAQRFYRHKSRKLSYQCWFWLIALVHLLVWYQALAPAARGIPYLPSGQQIRQVVNTLTTFLPGDFGPDSRERLTTDPSQTSAPPVDSETVSCPDSLDNVKVFTGTVISVSSQTGLVVRFTSTSDGTVQPSALPANFTKLYNKGDQVCVSIRQAVIENEQKHYELMLIE